MDAASDHGAPEIDFSHRPGHLGEVPRLQSFLKLILVTTLYTV